MSVWMPLPLLFPAQQLLRKQCESRCFLERNVWPQNQAHPNAVSLLRMPHPRHSTPSGCLFVSHHEGAFRCVIIRKLMRRFLRARKNVMINKMLAHHIRFQSEANFAFTEFPGF